MVDRGRVHNDRIETNGRNKRAESAGNNCDAEATSWSAPPFLSIDLP